MMNKGKEDRPTVNSLTLKESTHQTLKQHLFKGDNLEAAAIMLCHSGEGMQGTRLMVKELILIPEDAYAEQTETSVIWPFAAYMKPEEISRIDKEGLSIFTIHSHPNGYAKFSHIDNKNDTELFGSICGWFDDKRPNGSAVMVSGGMIKARTCDKNGKYAHIQSVSVVGDNIRFWKFAPKREVKIPGYAERISQTFGKGTFNLLRQLRVGVVGCSGTGSIIVELLARNCIGRLVLVDPDAVEGKNLNRILNTRKADATKGLAKVEVLKRAIRQMGMGVKVETHQSDTYDRSVIESLTDCDVIFGCVDSVAGRYHLECISSAYLIPYFDIGVYLEADGGGRIAQADMVANYVHAETDSLLTRGVYTSNQLASETWKHDDPKYYEQQRKVGYLVGAEEDQPAVISINMQAACLAFNDFLARLHNFRLDSNAEFTTQRLQLVQGVYLNEESKNSHNPIFAKYWGMGERNLLIQNMKREVASK